MLVLKASHIFELKPRLSLVENTSVGMSIIWMVIIFLHYSSFKLMDVSYSDGKKMLNLRTLKGIG